MALHDNIKAMFLVFVLLISLCSFAQTKADKGLDAVISLQDKLSKAVCDEAMISRPPTLEAAKFKRTSAQTVLDVALAVSESQLIGFLLGDRDTFLGADAVNEKMAAQAEKSGKESILAAKRAVSLEICTSVVTPGKIQELPKQKRSALLPAAFVSIESEQLKPTTGKTILRVRDIDDRYGAIDGKWFIPGWVEPFEVIKARTAGAAREYHRIANPITNRLNIVTIRNLDGNPLGFIYPSSEPFVDDLQIMMIRSENEANVQKLFETYKAMIELEAYWAVISKPAKTAEIRKLQEFYKNLVNAYRLYPNDGQFKAYEKKSKQKWAAVELRKIIDKSFVAALKTARVNGIGVNFALFKNDSKLSGIFSEYHAKLAALQ